MNPAVLSYVSPPTRGNPQAFLQNIRAYDAGIPVYLYSDYQPYELIHCQSPEVVRHPRALFRMSNHAFLTGLSIAKAKGISHMVYAEDDSRVKGDGWAARLIDEFNTYPGAVVGGTPVAYNISDSGHEVLKRVTEFAAEYLKASGTPMTLHGYNQEIYLYPNGSLSILDVDVVSEIFRPFGFESDIVSAARINMAWDELLGRGLWTRYGVGILDLFAPSVLSYSGCGDRVYREEERIAMLEVGEKIAIHQVKGNYK